MESMSLNLKPMTAQIFNEGDGGNYYNWPSSQFPVLSHFNVAAGRLLLRPRGFAFPHYADCSKVGYVIQGCNGVVGLVFPNESKEQVVKLEKGDVIPIPNGVVSWWFNGGDSDLEIIFLGETSNSLIHGDITYFFLAGTLGILSSFSPEFLSKAFNNHLDKDEVKKLATSQTGTLTIKLEQGKSLPKPQISSELVYSLENANADDLKVLFGGSVINVTKSKFPFIGKTGLSASFEKLHANAIRSPVYTIDSSVQVIYVVSGSGRVEIVGLWGKKMEIEVKTGDLLVVPNDFVIGKDAGEAGMECFSIITTTKPVLKELTGKASVWEALSPEVLQVSLNVSADFEKKFKSIATEI